MKILFKSIVGSHTYGTNIEGSDIDYKGIFIQNKDDILGFKYKEQIDVSKDETIYEVKRFLQLLQTANPTMLELLYMPDEFVLSTSKEFDLIKSHRNKFLTKKCLLSFGCYAISQIKKAKGLNKKMNWEKSKIERKSPLDFCYAYEDGKTIPLKKWLSKENKIQEYCGLAKLNHFKDCYALFYDYKAVYGKESIRRGNDPDGFKGIINYNSNSILLSSIPKYCKEETIVYYNQDGYSEHCKDYREYQEWIDNRNTLRYVDSLNHNQKIDGKNLMHCKRLLDMCIEIALNGFLNVKRPNSEELISIRRGQINLDSYIEKCTLDIDNLEDIFRKSSLPDNVDPEFVNDLLVEIRNIN